MIYKVGQTGIGFKVPDRLLEETRAIPAGTEVIVYIGRKLDRESIGIYQYELRSIKTKEGMEIGSFQ